MLSTRKITTASEENLIFSPETTLVKDRKFVNLDYVSKIVRFLIVTLKKQASKMDSLKIVYFMKKIINMDVISVWPI